MRSKSSLRDSNPAIEWRLARKELQIIRDAGIDQRLKKLDGVGHVDVIIAGAERDEHASLQICRRSCDRCRLVSGFILRGQAEIALGVDRIVVAKIGHGSDCNASLEAIGVGHGIEG